MISGRIFDVAVDVRPDSSTFGRWHGTELDEGTPRFLWIPPGFAHGLCVLSPTADVIYKCTELYAPEDEAGIQWNDPALAIDWPIDRPLLSEKDRHYEPFSIHRADLPRVAPA